MTRLCVVYFAAVAEVGCRCVSCGGQADPTPTNRKQRIAQRTRGARHGVDLSDDLAALLAALPASG